MSDDALVGGPEKYKLRFDANDFAVTCVNGTSRFSGVASANVPKLYIASVDSIPLYVGVTMQTMRRRLSQGWKAKGENGYHGYSWRHDLSEVDLDIWIYKASKERHLLDAETLEAEVVFLIRAAGQWPRYQTEIHFHPSTECHRRAAVAILGHYNLAA